MTFIEKLKWLFSGETEIPTNTNKDAEVAGNGNLCIKYIEKPKLGDDELTKVLLKHPIFLELREWGGYKTKVLNITDPIKRNMAKFYLEILFGKLQESIKTIVIERDTYLTDIVAINNLLIETIDEVQKTALAGGVPDVFLGKFTNYLYNQMKLLDSTYRDLDRFDYYNSDITKATVRLDLEFLTIRNITSEVETVINDMNGELRLALEGSIFDN